MISANEHHRPYFCGVHRKKHSGELVCSCDTMQLFPHLHWFGILGSCCTQQWKEKLGRVWQHESSNPQKYGAKNEPALRGPPLI